MADGTKLDFETATSHNVIVKVTDSGGLTYKETFTVTLTGVNEFPPTDISLSDDTVEVNSPTGTVVGTFSAVDPDAGDTHSYALPDTAGGRFKVVGNQLQVDNAALLNVPDAYSITAKVTDSGGLTYQEELTITVTSANSLVGFDVQQGTTQRSYIRYVDLLFTSPDGLADLIAGGQIRLQRYGLNGANGQVVNTGQLSTTGNRIRLDFGTTGLAATQWGDGYYEVGVDLDGNGSFETVRHFYRLMGDVNGDRVVNATDRNLILASYLRTGTNLAADVDGSGNVSLLDWFYAYYNNGKQLATGLPLDD